MVFFSSSSVGRAASLYCSGRFLRVGWKSRDERPLRELGMEGGRNSSLLGEVVSPRVLEVCGVGECRH